MQKPHVPRETFIALRARREAYQIATDILYEEPIDVRTVICQGCGDVMKVGGPTITDPITCLACGERTALPKYFRAKYLSRKVPRFMGPDEERWQSAFGDVGRDEHDEPAPRWVWWFSLTLLVLLVLAAIVASVFAKIPY